MSGSPLQTRARLRAERRARVMARLRRERERVSAQVPATTPLTRRAETLVGMTRLAAAGGRTLCAPARARALTAAATQLATQARAVRPDDRAALARVEAEAAELERRVTEQAMQEETLALTEQAFAAALGDGVFTQTDSVVTEEGVVSEYRSAGGDVIRTLIQPDAGDGAVLTVDPSAAGLERVRTADGDVIESCDAERVVIEGAVASLARAGLATTAVESVDGRALWTAVERRRATAAATRQALR